MKRVIARYGIGWFVATAALVVVLPRVVPGANGYEPILPAVALAGVVDLIVFSLVLYGLVAAPRSFLKLWGAAEATKVLTFGTALVVASRQLGADAQVFSWSLASSFVVYIHNEVFVFAKLSDRDLRPRAGVGD